jgi:hypothetical protein
MKLLIKHIQLVLISVSIILCLGCYHSIHISYGNATLDSHTFSGRIIFYKDDFFKAINTGEIAYHQPVSNDIYDQLKRRYLQSHLTVLVNNNTKLDLVLSGNSEDASSIWFDFKFESSMPINFINIQYDALFNEFSGQMNLLNIKTPSKEQSLIFSESEKDIKVQL